MSESGTETTGEGSQQTTPVSETAEQGDALQGNPEVDGGGVATGEGDQDNGPGNPERGDAPEPAPAPAEDADPEPTPEQQRFEDGVAEYDESDDRPVWNVETHGPVAEDKRNLYRVIGEQ